jgi:hypothetical protein
VQRAEQIRRFDAACAIRTSAPCFATLRSGRRNGLGTDHDGLDAGSFEHGEHGADACDPTHAPWRAHVLCAGRVYGAEADIVGALLDCLVYVLGRRA